MDAIKSRLSIEHDAHPRRPVHSSAAPPRSPPRLVVRRAAHRGLGRARSRDMTLPLGGVAARPGRHYSEAADANSA